jgi:hypothetical protein
MADGQETLDDAFHALVDLAVRQTNDPGIWLEARSIQDRGRRLASEAASSTNIQRVSQALRRTELEFRRAARADMETFEQRIRIQQSRDTERLKALETGNQELLLSMRQVEIAGRKAGVELSLVEGLTEELKNSLSAVRTIRRQIIVSIQHPLRSGRRALLMHRLRSIGRTAVRHALRAVFGFGVLTLLFGILTDAVALVIGNVVALAAVWGLQEYVLGPRLNQWLERRERQDLVLEALRIHYIGVALLASRRMVSQQLSALDEHEACVVDRNRATAPSEGA